MPQDGVIEGWSLVIRRRTGTITTTKTTHTTTHTSHQVSPNPAARQKHTAGSETHHRLITNTNTSVQPQQA